MAIEEIVEHVVDDPITPVRPSNKRSRLEKGLESSSPATPTSSTKITPYTRMNEYQNTFNVIQQQLVCKSCNTVVDYVKKSIIDQHLNSLKHKILSCAKTIDFTVNERNLQFTHDVIEMFSGCNIPLEKVGHTKMINFFRKWLKDVPWPSVSRVRNEMPNVYKNEYDKFKMSIRDSKVAVIADESTTLKNKAVLTILIKKLDFGVQTPIQADTVFIEPVNNQTVAKAIVATISKLSINFDNIIGFNSDNVGYMTKAYNDTLKTLFSNCIHIGCYAHIMALLGTAWRLELKELDAFITSFKSIFVKASHRRSRYLEFLHEKGNIISNYKVIKMILDIFFIRCIKANIISMSCCHQVEHLVFCVPILSRSKYNKQYSRIY